MPKRTIILLDKEESPWPSFLEEFFNDTASEFIFFQSSAELSRFLNRGTPDLLFLKEGLLPRALIERLKATRQAKPELKVFCLQEREAPSGLFGYDFIFTDPYYFQDFQKKLTDHLPLSERLDVLVIDDEPEVAASLSEGTKERSLPAFDIRYAANGRKGLEEIEAKKPDVIVLDIKMPEMDGREVYAQLQKRIPEIPVIIFFDAIFGDEAIEIHKIGRPAIVEKGSRSGNTAALIPLIQKMAFFG